jgi:murein DD-endopeptidase MepM/ murein hydrolase activator NlpD
LRSVVTTWGAILGLVATLVLGSNLVFGGEDVPDVGLLSPVYARPAERVAVRTLSQGETVGEILLTAMDANDQYALLLALREQASPRRMRPGTEISFHWLPGEGGENEALRAVDITLNKDETVRLRRSPSGWASNTILTPVSADTVFASGEISGSLWTSMVDDDELLELDAADRAELIMELALIYRWQVDFERDIRDGDYFRFAYEREVRPDGTTRAGRILSAELVNRRRSFTAVYFDPDRNGQGTYYDLDGESVKAMFLRSPIAITHRLSSRFSNSRYHPILKRWRAHRGVDFGGVAEGTPIQATGNGTIIRREWSDTYGNWIEIRHANGYTTRYAHMKRFRGGLGVGSAVTQEQTIGYVGQTGLAQGAHVHYEMRQRGEALDPLALDQGGDPVPGDQREAWQAQRGDRFALLEARVPRPWEVELILEVRSDNAQSEQEGSD